MIEKRVEKERREGNRGESEYREHQSTPEGAPLRPKWRHQAGFQGLSVGGAQEGLHSFKARYLKEP